MSDPVKASDVSVELGELVRVLNQNPHPAANKHYNAVLLVRNGKLAPGLATDYQIEDIFERARKNPEDIPDQDWWDALVN